VIVKGQNPENQGSQTSGTYCICFSVIIQHAAFKEATVFCRSLVQQLNRTSKEAHQPKGVFPLTVQLCRDIINNTLLRVRVLNRWIIIRYKVALKILKQTNQYNLQEAKKKFQL
jgi:hypothetical protein